uniref:Uncharacterized protein n=1 Tax=Magallana gigas TaxID=29159 RepID=A0A8W8IQR0_MAGGI
MRILFFTFLICSFATNFGNACDENDCQDDYDEIDDVIARGGPRFACRPLKEYVDCLKDHLEDCPTQHRTAIQNVRSKWTQYISTCALTLPFQDDDSSERLRDEQTRNDEVRSQLNGMVSLSQSNINQYVGTQRTAGDQVLGN